MFNSKLLHAILLLIIVSSTEVFNLPSRQKRNGGSRLFEPVPTDLLLNQSYL